MSYVVLARKYRPLSFDQMVGQDHVVRALTNALQQQRLHHAYLFTGTRGIGKTTVSRILAKSLNCTGADGSGGITAHPCGVCQACTEIDADRYLDYTEMDAASNGGKDEIRELIERAAYKPGIGRFKVFMIDEAHQLSKDAFNALLKTLEEPPEYLKFVLATTDPDKVLPTVLSRCLQFNLRPMAPDTVQAHLQQVLQAEQVPAEPGALRLLARAARGSMRDGLSLTDQAIAYGGGRLDEAVVRTMLGSVDRSHARTLVDALARRDGRAVLAAVDGLRALGLSAAATLEELAALLQRMAVQQAVPGALDAADPDNEDVQRLAQLLPPDETQLLYGITVHGRGELALMDDEYGALTMVLLRLFAFPRGGGDGAPAPAPAPAPALTPADVAAPAVKPAAAADSGGAGPASAARPQAAAPAPPPTSPISTAAAATTASAAPAARAVAAPPVASVEPVVAAAPPTAVVAAVHAVTPAPQLRPPAAETRTAPLRAPAPPTITLPAPPAERAAVDAARSAVVSMPPMPTPAVTPPPAVHEPTPKGLSAGRAQPTPLADRWHALVLQLAERGAVVALARELAWQAGLVGIDDDGTAPPVWRLQVERESLRSPALRDKLAAALEGVLGAPLQLLIEPGTPDDTPARRDAAERARRQVLAEQTIRSDPAVLALMAQFKSARIVPGSIKPV